MNKQMRLQLIRESIIYILGMSIVAAFWKDTVISTSLLIVLVAIRHVWKHKKNDYVYYFVGGFLGTLAEMFVSSYGAWNYPNPSLFNVPLWLPFAWGLATLLTIRVGETFIIK